MYCEYMYKPSIRQIEYFITLSKTLSFSKAAEQMHITQSALSNAIQDLEYGLKLHLFERSSRRVFLTEQGEILQKKFIPLLESYQDILSESESLTDHDIMNIRLGIIPTIAPYLLPEIIKNSKNSRPTINFSITETLTRHVLEKISLNQIDVGLIALPHPLSKNMKSIDLFDDELYLAIPNTEQDKFPKELMEKDIQDLKLLLLEDGHCLRDHAISSCSISSPQIDSDFSGSSLPTVLSMVAQQQGYSLVPSMLVSQYKGGDVAFVPFKDSGPKRTISLVWSYEFSEKKARHLAQIVTKLLQ